MTRDGEVCQATQPCRVVRARTIVELDDAARIRGEVYSKVMGLESAALPSSREINGFDVLDTTSVFVAYVDERAVGTLRLTLPNADVRAHHGLAMGLPIESGAAIEGIPSEASVAELGRAAVVPDFRGSSVIGKLYDAAYRASRAADVTHWIGFGLTATDDPEDATIIAQIIETLGKTAAHPSFSPHQANTNERPSARGLYTPDQRARAKLGDFAELRLPGAIAFHLGTGVTVIGSPLFDATFREFMIPIFLSLDDFLGTKFGRRYCGRGG